MQPSIANLFDLSGRCALVTGGNSGIGGEIARALAAAGASVVLVARRQAELDMAAARIAADGGRAAAIACDLADRAAVFDCAARAAAFFGAPDIVVNAAGVNIRRPMLEITEDDWDATMSLNLAAPFFLSQRLAPAMIAKGWGRIVYITSVSVKQPIPFILLSNTARAGLAGFMKTVAREIADTGVTVNAVLPGTHDTDRVRQTARTRAVTEIGRAHV